MRNLAVKNDTLQTLVTKGGTFLTNKKCLTNLVLDEFNQNHQIQWNLHIDSSPGPHKYDKIIGRDLMSELGITLNFSDQNDDVARIHSQNERSRGIRGYFFTPS